jgi:PadR family transcriptional regulator PadR
MGIDNSSNIIYNIPRSTKYIVVPNNFTYKVYMKKVISIEIRKELKVGFVELAILSFLSVRDLYGYELSQEFEVKSKGTIEVKEGTLYPILYRLEERGIIESYWEAPEGRGKPRKYYRLTPSGKEYTALYWEEWLTITRFMNHITEKGVERR